MSVLAEARCWGKKSVGRRPNRKAPRITFANLTLARKVALIPALTLLLMGVMLAVATEMGGENTAALRALDRDVFEPLSRAQTLKERITLLHTRLFALLSIANNESNPPAQKAASDALVRQLSDETANFNHFLEDNAAIPPSLEQRLRQEFVEYTRRLRQAAGFAAYDASYGALLAGATDEHFGYLSDDLNALVQSLAERRAALAAAAIHNSRASQRQLLGIGFGAALLALLGSLMVGRSIANPVLRLTQMMDNLAAGQTDDAAPGIDRHDEVGAMAQAVEVFRANLIARRRSEDALRRTNLQFNAALNSMLQGMIVWGPDGRVQSVNGRFFAITGLPPGCIAPDLSVREVIDILVRHGLYAGASPVDVNDRLTSLLISRRSMQLEMEMRPGLLVQITTEPMANGGSVVTFEDVTQKRASEAQIAYMAHHDALTGLPNRTLFREHMDAMLDQFSHGQPFGVMCLDLDYFKEVNDTLGHPAGDELLRLVAQRLRNCVRDHDLIARLGGDEFAIVVACPAAGSILGTLATRIVETIAAPYDLQGQSIVIGTSIGIATSAPGLSSADLLKRADVALYRAKEDRGTFAFFESGMDDQLQARRGLEADLRTALQRREFELLYQPLYSMAEDRVTGFEALIRWDSPNRGRVSPADFIAVAEQTGLIVPIGDWVLATACAEAASWPDHVRVSVNLSAVQTKNAHLVARIAEILRQTGLPPRRLELEITETVLLQDTDSVIMMLNSLHEMGVRVSMDDFGTGYSSMSYLRRFPFDKIKIDRSFIGDLCGLPAGTEDGADPPDALSGAARSAETIVRTIVGLGNSLGISTVAEGVETGQQFFRVRQNGCTEVQGFFISPPRPANEVPARDSTLPALAIRKGATPLRVA